MPKYRLVFSQSAQKDIKKLDSETRRRIANKLLFFVKQKDPLVHARQLIHSKIGGYRFRVGHYRIVFDVKEDRLEVINVKHRREIYRK